MPGRFETARFPGELLRPLGNPPSGLPSPRAERRDSELLRDSRAEEDPRLASSARLCPGIPGVPGAAGTLAGVPAAPVVAGVAGDEPMSPPKELRYAIVLFEVGRAPAGSGGPLRADGDRSGAPAGSGTLRFSAGLGCSPSAVMSFRLTRPREPAASASLRLSACSMAILSTLSRAALSAATSSSFCLRRSSAETAIFSRI